MAQLIADRRDIDFVLYEQIHADEFSRYEKYRGFNKKTFDLIINGTSASMKNELPPLPASVLAAHSWCYDMMYGNEPTIFMKWARDNGAMKYLDGLGMLVEQAAESFYLWRNVRPDTAPVIELLRNKIQ